MGRRRARNLTVDDIAKALRYTRGMIATAAHNLGASRTTLYKRIQESATLQEIITEERERMTDFAENKLLDAMRAGEVQAIKFYLATQGRSRGYVQRTETDLTSDGQRLSFTLNIGDAGPDADSDS